MTHRVGAKGQVVIPKPLREAIGIAPGDEVTFVLEGSALRVQRVGDAGSLMGRLRGHKLTAALEADRRAERRR
ncbi:MAG TPA: AbrB/MazE/SpoVT family DNA-binding domain-containing protein [Vicinamibacteria bacterium]|nr:AbrB/MazE/SpoVT family DNA-binding domain-containing protein [Vicinamibacteria bacterium]